MLQVLFFILLSANLSFAKVDVMFHPKDPTLEQIALRFEESRVRAQVVLYNIDVVDQSPLIQYFKSAAFKKKLQSGYRVQILFEGYGTPDENAQKMRALEALGFDVRTLGKSQKVHHKFAVLDNEFLITGSANWSLGSQKNYDENILFIQDEPGIVDQFRNEFHLLWSHSQSFGKNLFPESQPTPPRLLRGDLHTFFNSENFVWSDSRLTPKPLPQGAQLTRTLVKAIDQSRKSLQIATTRIKLAPVYEALLRAARRGVEIQIVVSQAEYATEKQREKMSLNKCADPYHPTCSSGVNFTPLLSPEVTGFDNLQIRLKFFSLDFANQISSQMHNKYIIIDGRWVLTGSFNWSHSSEWNHIENLVVLDGLHHAPVLTGFQKNFEHIWDMNRDQDPQLKPQSCQLTPMVLTLEEIDDLRSKIHCH